MEFRYRGYREEDLNCQSTAMVTASESSQVFTWNTAIFLGMCLFEEHPQCACFLFVTDQRGFDFDKIIAHLSFIPSTTVAAKAVNTTGISVI